MKQPLPASFVLSSALALAGADAHAQADPGGAPGSGLRLGDVQVVIAQRLWAATWDNSTMDARVEVPAGGGAPVVKTAFVSDVSPLRVIPLTSISARFGDVTASVAGSWSTTFPNDNVIGGRVKRWEYDVGAAYHLTPDVALSLIYKAGKVSQVATSAANALLGLSGDQKLSGWLIGFAASAPVNSNWRLYGNAAFSISARSRVDLGLLGRSTQHAAYQIGEVGFNYAVPGAFGPLSSVQLQVGYRAQILKVKGAKVETYSTDPTPVLLGSQSRTVQSTTQGLIFSIVGVF